MANDGSDFKILSLSGGGFFGLYTAHILAELETRYGHPLARYFDLICGTSIGGILALGLAHEVSTATMLDAFDREGAKIFSDRAAPQTRFGIVRDLCRAILKPKYRAENLRRVIGDLLGPETTLGQAQHRVIVPAVNMTKGGPQLFKTPHHRTFVRDLRLRSVDIALATSAAPTYFPLAEINNQLFADGGLFANSPDFLGIHEAVHFLDAAQETIRVLSIGTTTNKFSIAHTEGRNFGSFRWMRGGRLWRTTISAQQQVVDFMLGHRLRDRYLRIDTGQSAEQERQLAIDVATPQARQTLRGLADGAVQDALGKPLLATFFARPAPTPNFFRESN